MLVVAEARAITVFIAGIILDGFVDATPKLEATNYHVAAEEPQYKFARRCHRLRVCPTYGCYLRCH